MELTGTILYYASIICLVSCVIVPCSFLVKDSILLLLEKIKEYETQRQIEACLECPYKKYFLIKENIELDSEFTKDDVKILLKDLVNNINSKTYISTSNKLLATYSDIGNIADRVCSKAIAKYSSANSKELNIKVDDLRQEVVNVLREYIDD